MPSPLPEPARAVRARSIPLLGRRARRTARARALPRLLRRRADRGGPARGALAAHGRGRRRASRRATSSRRCARRPSSTTRSSPARRAQPSRRLRRRARAHARARGLGLPRRGRAARDDARRLPRAAPARARAKRRARSSASRRRTSAPRAASPRTPPPTAALPADLGERTFVILGTSHYGEPDRFGLTRKPFATPFGATTTDARLVNELARAAGDAGARRGLLPRRRALDRVPGRVPAAPLRSEREDRARSSAAPSSRARPRASRPSRATRWRASSTRSATSRRARASASSSSWAST